MPTAHTLKKPSVDTNAGKCSSSDKTLHDAEHRNKKPTDGKMEHQLIINLRIPEEHVNTVNKLRDLARPRTAKARRDFEEDVRLRIHFGGQEVVCLPSKEGTRIVGAGKLGTGVVQSIMDDLIEKRTQGIQIKSPEPWEWVQIEEEKLFLAPSRS